MCVNVHVGVVQLNLTELRTFPNPPAIVTNVSAAVLVLLAPHGRIPKDRSWKASKMVMSKVITRSHCKSGQIIRLYLFLIACLVSQVDRSLLSVHGLMFLRLKFTHSQFWLLKVSTIIMMPFLWMRVRPG